MKNLERITLDPAIMGGKPCIRGLRLTVGTIIGLMASGHSTGDILKMYPYCRRRTFWKPYLTQHGALKK